MSACRRCRTCALLAIIGIRHAQSTADDTLPLIGTVVALVADARNHVWVDKRITDDALAIALVAKTADGNARLLAAENEVGTVSCETRLAKAEEARVEARRGRECKAMMQTRKERVCRVRSQCSTGQTLRRSFTQAVHRRLTCATQASPIAQLQPNVSQQHAVGGHTRARTRENATDA